MLHPTIQVLDRASSTLALSYFRNSVSSKAEPRLGNEYDTLMIRTYINDNTN